jgi:hypothetical protein
VTTGIARFSSWLIHLLLHVSHTQRMRISGRSVLRVFRWSLPIWASMAPGAINLPVNHRGQASSQEFAGPPQKIHVRAMAIPTYPLAAGLHALRPARRAHASILPEPIAAIRVRPREISSRVCSIVEVKLRQRAAKAMGDLAKSPATSLQHPRGWQRTARWLGPGHKRFDA